MIVLDTNVISALMQETPHPVVVPWLDRQPRTSIWTTSVNVLEIRSGLQALPSARRRVGMQALFEALLQNAIQGRIADFDTTSAQHAADLIAAIHKVGRPRDVRDTMIAGIVLANRASLATRNVPHFEDIKSSVINPWEA